MKHRQRRSVPDRESMLNTMAWERMNGATIREIAHRFGLSKSQVHRLVAEVEILPPRQQLRYELVPLPGGGYAHLAATHTPRQRAYRVRNHRRI
jgi:hypothetical protein